MCFYIARGNYLLKVIMRISNFLPEKDLANGVVLVSLLLPLTYFIRYSNVSVINFEQVIAGWDLRLLTCRRHADT